MKQILSQDPPELSPDSEPRPPPTPAQSRRMIGTAEMRGKNGELESWGNPTDEVLLL